MPASLSALQENLACLLAYDDKRCVLIRNMVPPELWGGPYRELSRRLYEYIDRYKKAPKDHIADIFADKLENKKNTREVTLYEDILLGIRDQHAGINAEYVMSQLEAFVKRQSLRAIAVDVAKALQADTDESLEQAEQLLAGARQQTIKLFDPGLRLSDTQRVLDFLEGNEPAFPTGIPELDKRGFGPTRKEMWLFIAAAKRGKSWILIQLAKMAAIHRLKVCHVSLEMSQERVAQRYMQAFFAMAKRQETQYVTKFERDKLGRLTDLGEAPLQPTLAMDDPKIKQKLTKKIKQFGPRVLDNIYVKNFPTNQLTTRKLEAYLDGLENNEGFTPDLLILDYPDLFDIDPNNFRLEIDTVYKQIRGIAVQRNLALAIVSQGNRKSEGAKNVKNDNVAEAWSKIAHADCVVTYAQTEAEHKLHLARLLVSAGRNDEDKLTIIISQNYAMGAFAVDSVLMGGSSYWQLLPHEEGEKDD